MQNDLLKRLYIEPSSRCNLRCAMCFRNSWIDETTGDMSENTFRQVLAHLPESVETVFFGGMGEPLVHARITDMVRAVSAAGRRTELLSNGALLDEERAAALLDAGLDMLWLSVDALDDASYGSIRCNGNLARLKEHIAVLEKLSRMKRIDRIVLVGEEFRKSLESFGNVCATVPDASGMAGNDDRTQWFATSDEAASYLKSNPLKDCCILIKGSRGTKMENIIPVL